MNLLDKMQLIIDPIYDSSARLVLLGDEQLSPADHAANCLLNFSLLLEPVDQVFYLAGLCNLIFVMLDFLLNLFNPNHLREDGEANALSKIKVHSHVTPP